MKSFLLAFACLLACAPTLFSQNAVPTPTCTVATPADLCKCASQFNDGGTSIAGNILVTADVTFPLQCGENFLTIGALSLTIGSNVLVTIPTDLKPDAGAKDLTLIGQNDHSRLRYQIIATTYRRGGNGGNANTNNFADGQAVINSQGTSLPVDLMYWYASAAGGSVELNWATTLEQDNDFFSVEYSRDGVYFEEIERIDGRSSFDAVTTYGTTHSPTGGGTHYYRLSQQDFDGTRTSFRVYSIELEGEASLSGVYPNPARAGARLHFTAPATAAAVRLHYLDGREVGRLNVSYDGNAGSADLPADLPSGMYVLQAGPVSTRVMVR